MIKRIKLSKVLYTAVFATLILLLPGTLQGAIAQSNTPAATAAASQAPAKPASSTTTLSTSGSVQTLDLALSTLGVSDYELNSPSGAAQFRIHIPNNWQLQGIAKLILNLDYMQTGQDALAQKGITQLSSTLKVQVDNRSASTINLSASKPGTQTLTIPLPMDTLADPNSRSHTIRVTLNAEEYCQVSAAVHVTIHAAQSTLHFEYQATAPSLNLVDYPQPFYNGSFDRAQDSVLLVLPSKKTAEDLNAAASIMAGLGRMTGGQFTLKVADADTLSDQDRKSNNLLLIGRFGENPLIDQMTAANKFPVQRGSDGSLSADKTAVQQGDGILQLIANPDNPMRAVLAVTGQSADAVTKAAQALTGGPNPTMLQGPLAVVADFQPIPWQDNTAIQTRMTFADLGYSDDDLAVNGRGTRIMSVNFDVPLDMQVGDGAYVNLLYTYADNLNGARTTVTMEINGAAFASAFLDNQDKSGPTPTPGPSGLRTLRAAIPASRIRPGLRNTLAIVVDTQGNWQCYPPSDFALFFAASPKSELNLPLKPSNVAGTPLQVTWFPGAWTTSPALDDVLVSLPAQPTASELETAFGIVARLGASANKGFDFSPKIVLGDLPSGTDLSQYHVIAIGRPTTNPMIQNLNDKLPQPFVANSDELQQVLNNVKYRLAPGFGLGVIQALRSPWSARHVILVVSGSDADSEMRASSALLDPNTTFNQLLGDVIFVSQNAISPIDSRYVRTAEGALTAVPALSTESSANSTGTAVSMEASGTIPPSSTPMPSATFGPSPTSTPLYTLTPSPTVPTEIPTYAPLPPDATTPTKVVRPAWIDGLFGVTLLALVGSGLYGLYRATRPRRQG